MTETSDSRNGAGTDGIGHYFGLFVFGVVIGFMAALSRDNGITVTLAGLLFTFVGTSLLPWFFVAGGRDQQRFHTSAIPTSTRTAISNAVGLLSLGLLLGLFAGLAYRNFDMVYLRSLRNTSLASDLKTFPTDLARFAENPGDRSVASDKSDEHTGKPPQNILPYIAGFEGLGGRRQDESGRISDEDLWRLSDTDEVLWALESEVQRLERFIQVIQPRMEDAKPSERVQILRERLDAVEDALVAIGEKLDAKKEKEAGEGKEPSTPASLGDSPIRLPGRRGRLDG